MPEKWRQLLVDNNLLPTQLAGSYIGYHLLLPAGYRLKNNMLMWSTGKNQALLNVDVSYMIRLTVLCFLKMNSVQDLTFQYIPDRPSFFSI